MVYGLKGLGFKDSMLSFKATACLAFGASPALAIRAVAQPSISLEEDSETLNCLGFRVLGFGVRPQTPKPETPNPKL